MNLTQYSSHKALTAMVVKRPSSFNCTLIVLYCTRSVSLTSGIICWSLMCMGSWKATGSSKGISEPVDMSLMLRTSKGKYTWPMTQSRSIPPTTEGFNLPTRYRMLSSRNIWIRLTLRRGTTFMTRYFPGWRKCVWMRSRVHAWRSVLRSWSIILSCSEWTSW